ncbi:DUF423 domain-containing protein [Maribacter hydrothermalis]|uniref:DUF423 domain-containing protein n=1 Tax=Maribacter hydrothermalis TaxID=1836467 RepID=A0A1B7Z3K9_9FLAO|nr:DUF423 domain-containing protein [Maribacter hydrothermalis]APQ17017.1 hypothetical protein BTR34_06630 [Maribacter hydrothermalis]OBR37278.1 hypothetical protein A9200_06390 [Maribacter hydrothermalis]
MKKTILITGCVLGMLAVILGAFGAHGLKNLVDEAAIKSFETGVRYQMYHSFFLLVLALIPDNILSSKRPIYLCVVVGVVLFSLSIYLLALNELVNFDFKTIGIVTPIGGVFLIAAWVLMLFGILKSKTQN